MGAKLTTVAEIFQEITQTKGHPDAAGKTVVMSEEEPTTRVVTKTVTLELCQLRMLHATNFKSTQEKRFPNMTVTIYTRERKVIFGGKKFEIEAAEVAMNYIVKNMKGSSLEMSVEQVRLMRGIAMIRHLVDVLKNNDIFAVYAAVGDTSLGVFALNDEHLEDAIEVIRNETDEIYVEADFRATFQTQQWAALKELFQSQNNGLLTITESNSRVTLSGTLNSVAQAKDEIQRLLEKQQSMQLHSTVELDKGRCSGKSRFVNAIMWLILCPKMLV